MRNYEKYSSKVKRVILPLPDFQFFHRATQAGDVDKKFVGRHKILEILRNWLDVPPGSNGNDFTGAYLVTGYRGMGKTSFVGKVIDELSQKQSGRWWKFNQSARFSKLWAALLCMFPTILTILVLFIFSCRHADMKSIVSICIVVQVIAFVVIAICMLIYVNRNKTRSILKIKINIGNEISNTRDVLSLIAYSLRDRVKEHVKNEYLISPANIALQILKYMFTSICLVFLFNYGITVLSFGSTDFFNTEINNESLLKSIIRYINNVAYGFKNTYVVFSSLIGLLLSWGIATLICKIFELVTAYFSSWWGNSIYVLPQNVIKEISALCYRVDASISEDNSPYSELNISSNISFTFRRKKTRKYEAATIREIEHELIELIKKINGNKLLNCRFIIVLDELDKLCINNSVISEKANNSELPEFTNDDNGLADEMSSNEKQHKTLAFLSQLKYFVSTAQVKFVFIAGHELYDAYKADVSDREFSVSSIFNGVINVSSFFSYDSWINDVTRMTETYLCRQLCGDCNKTFYTPKDERDEFRLSEYRKRIDIFGDENELQHQREIETVMCLLKQFVTYLTFVSNGAPKKLTASFERYVISKEKFQTEYSNLQENMVVRLNESHGDIKYYLSLGYHDQQKIGFVHYMANPIFENIISPASDYGDKFLVSSSFLIAHIYKHHKSGFSWRNLEYLPELIDNNRTPELREFISSIIGYLGRVHLTNITSGIFVYKFPMKLAEEIAIFTKKSDELSAVFNFSMDYFSSVKRYYYRLIDFYSKNRVNNSVLSSIHHNLGDIHMANDEFSEAITQYRHAAYIIESAIDNIDSFNEPAKAGDLSSYIIRYIRVMLKLGLAYEKRNTIDSAHMIYTKISSKLIAYRDIEEKRLGLEYYYEKNTSEPYSESDIYGSKAILIRRNNKTRKNNFKNHCCPDVKDPTESENLDFWIYGNEIVYRLCTFLTPEKHSLITKLSVFEDLRLAYLPTLAKLLALEKHNICGITKDNLKLAESEFQELYLRTNSKDKYLLSVDFYRKLGDIMYYKNTAYHTENENNIIYSLDCWGYDLRESIFNYCYRKKYSKAKIQEYIKCFSSSMDLNSIQNISDVYNSLLIHYNAESKKLDIKDILSEIPKELQDKIHLCAQCCIRRKLVKNTPCYACRYYKRSLIHLRNNLTDNRFINKNISDSFRFLFAIEKEELKSMRFNELIQTALTLEAMGNTLLSCSTVSGSNDLQADNISSQFVNCIFKSYERFSDVELELSNMQMTHTEKAVMYYWGAMKYYSKAQNHKESMQALVKIFNTLSSYNAAVDKLQQEEMKSACGVFYEALNDMRVVVKDTISNIVKLRMCDNIYETEKLKRILSVKDINLELTSLMPEIEELLLSYYEVVIAQLGVKSEELRNYMQMFYESSSLTYLRNDSLIYNRMISLMFKARLNEKVMSMLDINFKDISSISVGNMNNIPDIFKANNNDSCIDKLIVFLIFDSIFCLTNIADVLSNPRTTLFSSGFCYGIYKRLYYWVIWRDYAQTEWPELSQEIQSHYRRLQAGTHKKIMLTKEYMSEMADKYIDDSISMHSEGNEYQNFIRNMYLLDDDLQNNTCQFYFALERMKLNSDFFKYIKLSMSNSNFYDPDRYYSDR